LKETVVYANVELRFRNSVEAEKWFNGLELDKEPRMTVLSSRPVPPEPDNEKTRCFGNFPNDSVYVCYVFCPDIRECHARTIAQQTEKE